MKQVVFSSTFDFIYAVAGIHMLIPDTDRNAFYTFIREHLICTMGDGSIKRRTDIRTSFDLQERIHEKTGRPVRIAGTSCRMVNFQNLGRELMQNGFVIAK